MIITQVGRAPILAPEKIVFFYTRTRESENSNFTNVASFSQNLNNCKRINSYHTAIKIKILWTNSDLQEMSNKAWQNKLMTLRAASIKMVSQKKERQLPKIFLIA